MPPVTRFAPSPTGWLHLGHVVNALWTWGAAAAAGGSVILRIEDHDRVRCRPEYEQQIYRDLEWLGFRPEPSSWNSLTGGGPSPFRQSDCTDRYAAAIDRLRPLGVYPCDCTRGSILQSIGRAEHPFNEEVAYPGTCRWRRLDESVVRGLRLPLAAEEVAFEDVRRGRQSQRPAAQCGDLLLRDARGQWTYQCCVVVDDLAQGVTMVVRGDDLLPSTGRQLQLRSLLGGGREVAFLHHPILRGDTGAKLSKKDRSRGLKEMRAAGMTAAEVLGEAARQGGLAAAADPVRPADAGALFAAWQAGWR